MRTVSQQAGPARVLSGALKITLEDQYACASDDQGTGCPTDQEQAFGKRITGFACVVELGRKIFLPKLLAKPGSQGISDKSGKCKAGDNEYDGECLHDPSNGIHLIKSAQLL